TGVNLSGLELNARRLPGQLGHDFARPKAKELDYYSACGARVIRLPFLWERLQPELSGPFDETYAGALFDVVALARARGMKILLDPHQFGRRRVNGEARIIGEDSQAPAAAFAQFWGALAQRCQNADDIGFVLQNEPHDQSRPALVETSNRAIAAIRQTGA